MRFTTVFSVLAAFDTLAVVPAHAADERLLLKIVDRDTGKPIACRMHLKNARGVVVKVPKVPSWKDHFVFDGEIMLRLPKGNYTFVIERGAEYLERTGHFTIEDFADDEKTIDMKRFADMAAEGWYSGDLHIHRPPKEIELLMRAEDLYVAPVITWWNKTNLWTKEKPPADLLVRFDGQRHYHLMAGEDERGGGALLYFNLKEPLDITGAQREHPSPVTYLEQARKFPDLHVDVEKPFWWDAPAWIATGKIDTIGLANNHMHREGMMDNEAWGRPRDKIRYPSPRGNGRWSQDIYYHVLNCGLKIPPSAGSASGVLPNPVGYNRVYVYCGKEFSYEKWWQGLRAGRVMVTNGPLLRPLVEGKLPGHTFTAAKGQTVELEIGLTMSTREKVEYLEVVKNGRVEHEVRLDQWKENKGKLPPLKFTESGWFLVRAVTNAPNTFRFGSTGPYYVEIGYEKRISRASAQFFVDWVRERMKQIKLDDEQKQREVLAPHQAAEKFWQGLVDKATTD
jgi:hypothetical protein